MTYVSAVKCQSVAGPGEAVFQNDESNEEVINSNKMGRIRIKDEDRDGGVIYGGRTFFLIQYYTTITVLVRYYHQYTFRFHVPSFHRYITVCKH